ncbi:MAG: hypothetical protein WC061_05165, partial [Melioribacteraceae bacterium]
ITSFWEPSGESTDKGATLMAKMVKEQLISYKSGDYQKGISQFRNNMTNIFELIKEAGIPVIIGTLTANLRDQVPFATVDDKRDPKAADVFNEAKIEFARSNFHKADSLFRYARDLDALRFRAPGEINKIIMSLGKNYNAVVVDVESVFNSASPGGITGSNLMVDHLHPTLPGYLKIGNIYFEAMKRFLPAGSDAESGGINQDSLIVSNFSFSMLDSAIANYRIINLKNDWPFKPGRDLTLLGKIVPESYIDSLAYKVAFENFLWETAHNMAAERYLRDNDLHNYALEMKVLSSQYPFKFSYWDKVIYGFIKSGDYDDAYPLLLKRNRMGSDEFTLKWLGNINLMKGDAASAVMYLEKSLMHKTDDAQVYFNLALAYSGIKENEKAADALKKCLSIDPSYPDAQSFLDQLQK